MQFLFVAIPNKYLAGAEEVPRIRQQPFYNRTKQEQRMPCRFLAAAASIHLQIKKSSSSNNIFHVGSNDLSDPKCNLKTFIQWMSLYKVFNININSCICDSSTIHNIALPNEIKYLITACPISKSIRIFRYIYSLEKKHQRFYIHIIFGFC